MTINNPTIGLKANISTDSALKEAVDNAHMSTIIILPQCVSLCSCAICLSLAHVCVYVCMCLTCVCMYVCGKAEKSLREDQ